MANDTNISPAVLHRQDKEKLALLEALKEMPIIQVACRKAGVSRPTYYRWRKEDKNFFRQTEDAIIQGFEFINDMSESQVITLIKEKKLPAIVLWLKHHHPLYGSKTQSYKPVPSAEDLDPEEEKIVLEALALASGVNITQNQDGRNNNAVA